MRARALTAVLAAGAAVLSMQGAAAAVPSVQSVWHDKVGDTRPGYSPRADILSVRSITYRPSIVATVRVRDLVSTGVAVFFVGIGDHQTGYQFHVRKTATGTALMHRYCGPSNCQWDADPWKRARYSRVEWNTRDNYVRLVFDARDKGYPWSWYYHPEDGVEYRDEVTNVYFASSGYQDATSRY